MSDLKKPEIEQRIVRLENTMVEVVKVLNALKKIVESTLRKLQGEAGLFEEDERSEKD